MSDIVQEAQNQREIAGISAKGATARGTTICTPIHTHAQAKQSIDHPFGCRNLERFGLDESLVSFLRCIGVCFTFGEHEGYLPMDWQFCTFVCWLGSLGWWV